MVGLDSSSICSLGILCNCHQIHVLGFGSYVCRVLPLGIYLSLDDSLVEHTGCFQEKSAEPITGSDACVCHAGCGATAAPAVVTDHFNVDLAARLQA